MKRKIVVLITIMMVLQFCCGTVWAQITTANQAQKAVAGWLKPNARPLKAALGRQIAKVVPYTDIDGEPLYYIVYLKPQGFVIVSADDLVEPIIGFADDGTFDPSPENPLGALVTNDLNERIKAARKPKSPPAMPAQRAASNAKNRWTRFIS